MPEALLLFFAMLGCIAGMGWLALAMDGHWAQVRGGSPPRATVLCLRVWGASGLAVALALCLAADHASMAVLVWVMALAVGALTVALTLTWRPRLLVVLTWVASSKTPA